MLVAVAAAAAAVGPATGPDVAAALGPFPIPGALVLLLMLAFDLWLLVLFEDATIGATGASPPLAINSRK